MGHARGQHQHFPRPDPGGPPGDGDFGFSVHDIDEGIEGRRMLAEGLSLVEANRVTVPVFLSMSVLLTTDPS